MMPANLMPLIYNISPNASMPMDLSKAYPGIDTIQLLAFFFIPGFISMKVYDSLVSKTQSRDFSNVYEAFGYSFINFLVISNSGLNSILNGNFINNSFYLIAYLLILPSIWPLIYILIKYIRKALLETLFVNSAEPSSSQLWDLIFSQNKARWIIVHLKDGRSIGGWYGEHSYCSSFPSKEQIYLEEVYKINENGEFEGPIIERTDGILILGDDISAIEFFKSEDNSIQ